MMVRTRHWVRRWLAAAFAPWILLHPNSPGQARERGASSNGFSEMKPHLKRLAGVLALAAVYFCAGKLGLLLAFVNASVSPVWPPTGIALAALLMWGYRLWPGIFLGAFLVNFTTTGTPVADLGIAAGNTLEALLGAWLVNRYVHGVKAFDRAYDIFKFVLLAGMVSTAVSATFGATTLCLWREARWEQYPAIWSTWWLGDMLGALIVAPLLLIWVTQPFSRPKLNRLVEGSGMVLVVVVLGLILFLDAIPGSQFKYLAILPLLWAAFRFGQRGAITSATALSVIALWGTLHGVGPFVASDANKSLLLFQAFVSTMTVMVLVVAAAVSERDRFERRLQIKDVVRRVLAESSTLKEAAPKIIQGLCETGGWDSGAIWSVDRGANELYCVEFWRRPSMEVSEFEAISRQCTFAPGIGLPGRVWSNGEPAWIRDVTRDGNFPRSPLAQKEGLHTAFCFPIKLGDLVLGVVECFSRQVREPDEDFLRMLDDIGRQLGQFIAARRAEEARLDLLRRMQASLARTELAKAEVEKQLAQRRQVEEALGRWATAPLSGEARSGLWRFGVAAAATGCALLLRLLFDPVLEDKLTLVTAYGAVAFAAWYGGRGAAFFACAATYLGAGWLFIEPRYRLHFSPGNLAGLSLYLVSCFIVISISEAMRRAQRHAHASAGLAVARQREVEAEMEERQRAEQAVREREQQTQRELEDMRRLQVLSHRLAQTVDMRSLLEQVLDAAIAVTRAERGNVHLIDLQSGALKVVAQRGFQEPFVDLFAELHRGEAAFGKAAQRGDRILFEDVLSSELFAGSPVQQVLLDAGVRSVQSIPLPSRSGQLMGIISTYSNQPRPPELRQVQVLDLLARQAADFIERCRTDETLRQNEERMRIILDTALDAVITIDGQGRIVSWNPQAEKTFGWSPAEAVGKKLTDTIIPPHFREPHDRGLRRYFETGFGPLLNKRLEMTALHRDGREFPVELAIAPVVVEDEVYFSAFVRDITERKRAEERLRLVVEAAPNAMIMVGPDGCIAMVNAQAEKLFGYERTELVGKVMDMLVPERFHARHPGMRHGFFAEPQTRPMGAGRDLYGRRKDGSEVAIETGLSPIQTAEGPFVLASIVDITERKRAEERLLRFNAELESRVEEHTAELTETTAQLRTTLREREVLLQEIHHRVKNNLQIVASLLSLQSGSIRDPQMAAHFQESQERIRSMALIHEKLYQSESLARVDLADYVKSLVGILLRTYATAGNVDLQVRLDPAFVSIDTAVPVGLLLNELLTNALKYAFPKGRKGCLLVELEAKPDGQYVVRVEDDGVGLGPDFQLEQANTLGMRLVRMLAKQLDAELSFRSGSGHTTFDIRFQELAAKSA